MNQINNKHLNTPSSSPLGDDTEGAAVTQVAPTPHASGLQKSTNGLAIASLVATFFIPIVGFILGIIALKQIKERAEGGKGLAIASIVLSSLYFLLLVLGICAALVVVTFSGVQSKARDTERETDIKAIHAQVEAYQATYGSYPSLGNLNDAAFRSSYLKGLDIEAFRDPKTSGTPRLQASQSYGFYAYATYPENCDNPSNPCTDYILSAVLEDGTIYSRRALAINSTNPSSSKPIQVEDLPFSEDGTYVPDDDFPLLYN